MASFVESLEPRTLLSGAGIGHLDARAADAHGSVVIHANLKHARRHGHKASRVTTTTAAIGSLSASGPFSFSFGNFVLSGTIDGSTHAVTATLVGPGVQFDIVGTFDVGSRHLQGTITGDRTNLTADGTLGANTITGSLEGTLFGTAISFNGTVPL